MYCCELFAYYLLFNLLAYNVIPGDETVERNDQLNVAFVYRENPSGSDGGGQSDNRRTSFETFFYIHNILLFIITMTI